MVFMIMVLEGNCLLLSCLGELGPLLCSEERVGAGPGIVLAPVPTKPFSFIYQWVYILL
jgi:hypothetical protein